MSLLQQLSSNIKFYYDFRKGLIKDESGNTTATKVGTPILTNNGLKLAGGSFNLGKIDSGAISSLTFIGKFTTTTTSKYERFFTRFFVGAGNQPGYIIFDRYNNNTIRFVIINSLSGVEQVFTTQTILPGKDYIIGLTYNAGTVKIFINGLKVKEQVLTESSIPAKDLDWYLFDDNSNVYPFIGNYYYSIAFDNVLTETEVAQLTGELENLKFPKKVISRTKAENVASNPKANELVDGDMEASGVSDWSEQNFPTLTKEASDLPGSTQCLRIARGGASTYPRANQAILESGKRYKLTGWARSDGNQPPYINQYADTIWAGTNSTDWQPIYAEFIADNATDPTNIGFYALNASTVGYYVEFDNILVQEIGKLYYDVNFKTDWGALANEKTISSGFIENTPFEVQSGSFKVISDTYNGEEVKAIECVSNGTFSLEQELDGTTWELYVDTGSGYAISDGTGIISSQVFTLTAGDKIILGNKVGDYGIIKK